MIPATGVSLAIGIRKPRASGDDPFEDIHLLGQGW